MISNSKVEQISKEMRLLLLFLKDGQFDMPEFSRDIQWDTFVTLAIHHRVFPVIYKKLTLMEKSGHPIPSDAIQALKKKYEQNIFRMLQLSGETELIANTFAKHEIKTLFLKGPVLAANLYGDISLRTSADLDILIPIEKLRMAEEILEAQGYVKDEYIKTILNDWKWRHHHITFHHPQKRLKVEIHWRLNPGPAKEPSFDELWKNRRASKLSSNPIYMLGYEQLFLFLVTHGSRHGWSRLRWLQDIDYLCKQDLDWNQVIKLLKRYHYLQIGGQALNLCSELLGLEINSQMNILTNHNRAKKLAEDAHFYLKRMINLHTPPVPIDVANYHKKHLFSLMSLQQKCLFIGSFFYPYPEDAEVLPLPKQLHFLYFPLRPFILVGKWRRKKRVALGGNS